MYTVSLSLVLLTISRNVTCIVAKNWTKHLDCTIEEKYLDDIHVIVIASVRVQSLERKGQKKKNCLN